MCVCVCVCPHIRASLTSSPLPVLPLFCMSVTRVGAPAAAACCAVQGGRVSWVCCCLTPVLHTRLLCVGTNAAWCLSLTHGLGQSVPPAVVITTQPSLKSAQVPLGFLGSAELCVGVVRGSARARVDGACPGPVWEAVRVGAVFPLPRNAAFPPLGCEGGHWLYSIFHSI